MREKYIEQKLVREVKKRGGLCEKWNSGSSGWPDRLVLLPDGKFGLVEVKAPGKKPRVLQEHRHDQLRSIGYKVFIKTIEKIWEYEQKIDAKINRLVDLRAAINAAIESMENPEERLLLKYRYLKNESWEDISYELNVSYRTVHRIHASALNNFVLPE